MNLFKSIVAVGVVLTITIAGNDDRTSLAERALEMLLWSTAFAATTYLFWRYGAGPRD